ncbi:hypothetical protein [Actinoplanes derwentensis]|uniref:HTH cro/C1-type domain-containing protein n=1 Tax=Actinoplanes derwentensis TaxID=113562 RepID=A0A1H2CWI5_9ACTN|nr:hypothetical protein [Actinoplanes derwentensis]GID82080.1 hypothetical protein Ade03nite_10040 [Actinoplanes derwentensis]SDT74572.1 hypothetical protein SAMN04489716_7023 [Actinoplanes derwentensis]
MSDAISRPDLKTLQARLNYLFETVRPHGKPKYSVRDVADAIAGNQDDKVPVTSSYIHYLRTGERDNPGIRQLVAIAKFFGVPAAFLLGEGDVDGVARDLAQLKAAVEFKEAMSDPTVAQFAIKARGLSPAMLQFVAVVLEQARELGDSGHNDERAGDAN